MVDTRSNTEQIADHYARYVGELREFLKSSGVLFGSPEHLAGLTKRLREDNVFREEMYAMTRSIIFREGGALPPAELLRLVAAAVGGTAVDEQAEQQRPEIRYLLHFLTTVTRTPVNQPRGEASRPAAADTAQQPASVASGPAVRPAATRWSGKPSAPALRWNELWNDYAVGGVKRLITSARTWWWIPLSVAALASLSLLLWLPHSKSRPPAVHESLAPVAAANPRQVAAAPEPTPVEEMPSAPEPPPTPPASTPRPEKASVQVRKHAELDTRSQKRPAAALMKKGGAPSRLKQLPMAYPVASSRLAPAKSSGTQVARAQPEPRSPLLSTAASSGTSDSGLRRGERGTAKTPSFSPSRRGTLDVSSGVMTANLISAPAPEYPKLARVMHLQGAVILQAVIDKNGQVTATNVLQGHHLLREAAIHAVRRWRYRPYLADGHPVDVATVVTVDFRRQH